MEHLKKIIKGGDWHFDLGKTSKLALAQKKFDKGHRLLLNDNINLL